MTRTCGNCAEFDTLAWECGFEEPDGSHAKCWADKPACDDWHEWVEAEESLEYRFDELSKVAMEMYSAMAPMHDPCCEDTCCNLADDGWPEGCCLEEFEERLKSLGVMADD